MSATLLQRYQQQLRQPNFVPDPRQLVAVKRLDKLATELMTSPEKAVKGLYLWGDVGRGKTFLMDLFFDSLNFEKSGSENKLGDCKLRLHFHHFMARMHRELNQESGHSEPLRRIAKRLAQQCRVLCFDEFFVSDIGDAMILGRLFEALFEEGVTLIATSNIPLERLYEGGLQRQRFEQTITLLQQYTTQFHLDGVDDHRCRHLSYQQTYFENSKVDICQVFTSRFDSANRHSDYNHQPLDILGRSIDVIQQGDSVVWLNFDALCAGPRSQLDYIALAKQFETVMISQVPRLGGRCRSWIRARGTEDGSEATETGERQLSYAAQDDPARRFISLVDELYDQNVNLYIAADVSLDKLYSGGALSFEFKRTYSRLTEMQSDEYLNADTITTNEAVYAI